MDQLPDRIYAIDDHSNDQHEWREVGRPSLVIPLLVCAVFFFLGFVAGALVF